MTKLEYMRKYNEDNHDEILRKQRERREYLKRHHRCIQCSRQDEYTLEGRARCKRCNKIAEEARIRWREKHKYEKNDKV